MKLSIIIPVYNVEEYVSSCLESCLKQDIPRSDYEIIVVNDGSTDGSLKKLVDYQQKYNNIKLINQRNQGLSVARNVGLQHAEGDYIWYVDSDDTIAENCLKEILDQLDESIDMLQVCAQYVYEDSCKHLPYDYDINWHGIIDGKTAIAFGGLPAPAPFTLYKRKFLLENKLFFVPGLLHEDCEFKPKATYLAKGIKYYKSIVYNYRQRYSGNIKSNFNLRNAECLILVINSLIAFMEDQVQEKECRLGFRRLISLNSNNIFSGFLLINNETDKEKVIKLLNKHKYILKNLILSKKIKYITEGLVFMINVRLGLRFYTLLHKLK